MTNLNWSAGETSEQRGGEKHAHNPARCGELRLLVLIGFPDNLLLAMAVKLEQHVNLITGFNRLPSGIDV